MMARAPLDLEKVLNDPSIRVVVTCGSGGVGKTTTAAAMAIYAADQGRKVAVLTIDPARRLAQSLGLGELDNVPRKVEFEGSGDAPSGELWAMMLDTSRTFDEMVSSNANADHAAKILANPFYTTISTSFSGTQEYMAMEKLSQLAATDEFDLIVVDTPPSRSALDFLDAPQRLSSFLDGRMIRLLASPGRGVMRIVGAGFQLFAKAVTSVVGGQMLADAATFVQLFEGMFGGFRDRAQATYDLLRSSRTAFVVVAVPEPDALREASYFADRLRAERMPLAGLVLNRTHPPMADLSLATTQAAIAEVAGSSPLTAAALAVHAERLTTRTQELRMRARLDRAHPDLPVVEVPALAFDAHDLPALRIIAGQLTGTS
ncbi:anion-transporting ArsA/GET3 family ATPase [Nakamurella sp. UYEF19]|uniref:ArsA family ATPase n=1 Tax=Nakamurella sp. UYEF19 TaxID=1756392 RepID=UPI003392E1B2